MSRFLYRGNVYFGSGVYTINCIPLNDTNKHNKRSLTFRGDEESFKKFLRKIKAKDSSTFPASSKQRTYQQIIDDAKAEYSKPIYIWSNMIPKGDSIITEEEETYLNSSLSIKEIIDNKFKNKEKQKE